MHASQLSQNHLKHNIRSGDAIYHPKRFVQQPHEEKKEEKEPEPEIIVPPMSTLVIEELP